MNVTIWNSAKTGTDNYLKMLEQGRNYHTVLSAENNGQMLQWLRGVYSETDINLCYAVHSTLNLTDDALYGYRTDYDTAEEAHRQGAVYFLNNITAKTWREAARTAKNTAYAVGGEVQVFVKLGGVIIEESDLYL